MDFTVFLNRDELFKAVISELKSMGIKFFKEKLKATQKNTLVSGSKRIFRVPLHHLELCDVILANGSVVQIPKFVADATNRILEQVETEGIFRKAGSSLRQKEIRVILENGIPLGKSHHVIDVANVIKYFFRELPEPLIPTFIQETMLRALLAGEKNKKAILLSCLLLPTLTINTLRFFMQFLQTVSLSENANKMSAENLAIILTPGLMPFGDINSRRFINHLKVVQILIENANIIGIVPINIAHKLQPKVTSESELSSITSANSVENINTKKKQKRRSDMFNGFKKLVGSAMGSTEELEKGLQKCNTASNILMSDSINPSTPYNKSRKKRKFPEPMSAFSLKKKRDLLALLPSNSGGLLPSTPLIKKTTKHRSSLNHIQKIESLNPQIFVSSIERRWSIVGSPDEQNLNNAEGSSDEKSKKNQVDNNALKRQSSTEDVMSAPCCQEKYTNKIDYICDNFKDHHNEIKDLIQIEISLEKSCNDMENIQRKYERILKETQALSLQKRDLFIREQKHLRRSCNVDLRSPSARKIGSIRRRETTMVKQRGGNDIINNNDVSNKNTNSKIHLKRSRQSVGPICSFRETTQNYKEREVVIKNSNMWVPGENFFGEVPLNSNTVNNTKQKLYFEYSRNDISSKRDLGEIFHVNSSASSPIVIKQKSIKSASTSKVPFVSRIQMSGTINNDDSGRASINQLRTHNAGMVIAKAKLFDRLGACNTENKYGISYNKTRLSTNSMDSRRKTINGGAVNLADKWSISKNVNKVNREENQMQSRGNSKIGRINYEKPVPN
ncbi:uncharacterized protein LOC105262494 isoform X2 [Musca domestica]|uniref:Uncharacterized protein LOC105262494 isoform X2 n=1 Tax=Musca domestica TaxID=7370 RepID=A0A1I8NL54_MUSDO|nr:uncharacterized protein LOC105262494 isoform X2 [Musca domestica]